jgi:hypothetical protein
MYGMPAVRLNRNLDARFVENAVESRLPVELSVPGSVFVVGCGVEHAFQGSSETELSQLCVRARLQSCRLTAQ